MEKIKQKAAAGKVKVKQGAKAQAAGFGDFIRSQGIVALAIGFVVGTQAKQLVDALTVGFINPIVGLILPGSGALKGRSFTLVIFSEKAVFWWGDFVLSLINFIVIAAVIYFLFKLLRLDRLDKKK